MLFYLFLDLEGDWRQLGGAMGWGWRARVGTSVLQVGA